MIPVPRSCVGALILTLGAAPAPLSAQSDFSLPELARWFEDEAPTLATSTGDPTATGNLRMVDYVARATLALEGCTLRITIKDNAGVSGFKVTTEVPLAAVNGDSVRMVSRPDGWHDFLYIPGQYFVVVPARVPGDWPFVTTTSRGSSKAYLTSVPSRSPDAGATLATAITRAAALCATKTAD